MTGIDRADPPPAVVARILVALAGGAGLFLAWQATGTLLLISAGLLFAALLGAATCGPGQHDGDRT